MLVGRQGLYLMDEVLKSLLTSISCKEGKHGNKGRTEIWCYWLGLFVAWTLHDGQVPSGGLNCVSHLSGDEMTHDKPRKKQGDKA